MKACSKIPIFNLFDLVWVGNYRSKVFKIVTVMYEKSIDKFVYSLDNLYAEECGYNCYKSFYSEDELTEAIPELAIGDTLRNLEITNVKYNDTIHEFEYEVCGEFGEFHTFAEVKELAKATRPRKGLIVKNGCTKGIVLAVSDKHQAYCVLWEGGSLSPYVPFDANYITFTSVVYSSYDDILCNPFFEGAYNDIINRQCIN